VHIHVGKNLEGHVSKMYIVVAIIQLMRLKIHI